MGRRALRKIDPSLDLSRHLFELESLPSPFCPVEWFGGEMPLEIEIGSGKGLFMETAAQDCDHHRFMGIEISRKYVRFAAARLAKKDLSNAIMIHGDAKVLLCERLPDECAIAVHVYFPDPWWKKRHRRRRVMTAEVIENIQRVLCRSGKLHFWTDVEEYFTTTIELINNESKFGSPIQVPPRTADHSMDYRTHFERRMRLCGENVYRAEFIKA